MKLTIKTELGVAFIYLRMKAKDGSTTSLRFLDLRSSSTMYARISLSDCFLVVRITFSTYYVLQISLPKIVQELPIYCDNNSDGKKI